MILIGAIVLYFNWTGDAWNWWFLAFLILMGAVTCQTSRR